MGRGVIVSIFEVKCQRRLTRHKIFSKRRGSLVIEDFLHPVEYCEKLFRAESLQKVCGNILLRSDRGNTHAPILGCNIELLSDDVLF